MPEEPKSAPGRKRGEKKRRAAAYHEAGHAVACHMLEHPFHYVTILQGEGTHGHCKSKKPPRWFNPELNLDDPRCAKWLDEEIIILYAGGAAERLFTGRYNHIGRARDYDVACELSLYRCGWTKVVEAHIRWLHLTAEYSVESPMWRPSISAVAQALLERETLSAQEVAEVIRAHWDALISAEQEARRQQRAAD